MSMNRNWTVLVVVVALGVSACADGGDAGNDDATATTQATTTPTMAPTTNAGTSEEQLVYVVLGNSLLFSTPAVMYAYRDLLEEDLGVGV